VVQSNIVRFERRPFAGTFTVRDAALFLRATTTPERTVASRWRREPNPKKFAATSQALYRWIRDGLEWEAPLAITSRDRVITFEDLIRLRLIAFLRARGFSYAEIVYSENFVRNEFRIPQPFVTETFWVAGDLLVEFARSLVSVSKGRARQTAFKELRGFFSPVEHGLSFEDGVASLWTPYDDVLIDPEIQFGAPCLAGTRVETETLWTFHQGGDSAESLAAMYGLDIAQVEAALGWERRIAAAMAA
jgi:uncharacterized protein (DUF433 family)